MFRDVEWLDSPAGTGSSRNGSGQFVSRYVWPPFIEGHARLWIGHFQRAGHLADRDELFQKPGGNVHLRHLAFHLDGAIALCLFRPGAVPTPAQDTTANGQANASALVDHCPAGTALFPVGYLWCWSGGALLGPRAHSRRYTGLRLAASSTIMIFGPPADD